MAKKWLIASSIIGCLISAQSKANVTYTFFDLSTPSTIDLEFQTTNQLPHTNTPQTMLDISGAFAGDFTGGTASYLQGSPGFQPVIDPRSSTTAGELTFDGFPFGNSANGVPGNGNFSISGVIFDTTSFNTLANIGSATISGVPVVAVPEPASLSILGGALLLTGLITRRRSSSGH